MAKPLIYLLLLLCACGCDHLHGVFREVKLEHPIANSQIEAALVQNPQCPQYTRDWIPISTSWSLIHGTVYHPAYYVYAVKVSDKYLRIASGWQDEHTAFFRMWFYGPPNVKPTNAEIEQARSLMNGLYDELRWGEPSLPPRQWVQERGFQRWPWGNADALHVKTLC